ncbi:MAG: chlorite dismutase family protein [Nitrospira defluvii]|nr:chlorite dismutase family protein [Nitrospira defluvii]
MNLWSAVKRTLMVGLLMVATAWPAHATERDKLLTEPGVYGTFAAFQMDHDWWDLTGEARVIAVSEAKGLIEQFSTQIVIESYLLRGLSDHADFMFRVHARALADTQQFLTSLLGTRFGRHLVATSYLHGLTKKAAYVPGFPEQMKTDLQAPSEAGTKSYAIVIPIRKDAEWWALDQDTRLTLMQEHTQVALPYVPAVKRKLYHSSGLDDFDFLTYFETEKLDEFHGLIRALEQVKEYRHNRRFGHPTLLGTVRPLDDILELFAR